MSSDKDVQMIMTLTGVDQKTAEDALVKYETVEDAIDALLAKPLTAGDRYLPQKRKIQNDLSPEQEARCKRGRWLQDKVNVVFSVAHSKTLPPQDEPSELQTNPETTPAVELPVVEESQSRPGSPEQTTQPNPRSETPQ